MFLNTIVYNIKIQHLVPLEVNVDCKELIDIIKTDHPLYFRWLQGAYPLAGEASSAT